MNVRTLQDNSGAVFSPKVSADSVYLSGSKTTLTSKLSTMDDTISGKVDSSSLATVATSGAYGDLSGRPSLATVATSGSYNDLSDKPSIGSTNWLNRNDSMTFGASGLQYFDNYAKGGSDVSNSNPTSDWYQTIRMNHPNGQGYFVDFSICFHSNIAAFRRMVAGSPTGWRYLVSSDSPGGNIYATGFYVDSSRKVKENIEPTKISGEDMINSVNIVDFNYINDETHAPKVGFIAEDTDPLFSTKERKAMDSANCIGILMKAVQELSLKVKNLTSELETLTSKIGGEVHG